MRVLRLITVLAVLLTLPFFGVASIAGARACVEAAMAAPAEHDCCPDEQGSHAQAETHASHDGAPAQTDGCGSCDSVHACKSPQSFESTSVPAFEFVPIDQPALGTVSARIPAHSPDLPLRPPQV
ncbi:MAG TPA: hypothetical protein VJS42_20475 [Steroidobacteraceae bacterium]|nr:hypothetical protein [Steroidobacteraceae bacterium]